MIKGPLEADGRLAAKNATKIRAALTQVTNFKSVFERYQETHPEATDNKAQDRARARAWLILNVGFNNDALHNAIMHCWAEAYVLGQDAAGQWIVQAEKAQKALNDGMVNWDNWKPGDRATALLVKPVGGFQRYLEQSGGASYFKKFDKETVEMLGTSLADAIDAGLDAESAALLMKNHVGSPGRALTIAITEQNRAMSFSTIQRYKEAELQKMEWHTSDPCDKCAMNAGQVIEIGGQFNSGNNQPPAHPHCRCVLLPVIPGYEEDATQMTDIMASPGGEGETYASRVTYMRNQLKNWEQYVSSPRENVSKEELVRDALTGYGHTSELNYNRIQYELINQYKQQGMGAGNAEIQANGEMLRMRYLLENSARPERYQEEIASMLKEGYDKDAQNLKDGLAYASKVTEGAMQNGRLTVAISNRSFDQVLEEGRFKNQFETKTSGGLVSVKTRKIGEKAAFDISADAKKEVRPIYGFLSTNDIAPKDYRDLKSLEDHWNQITSVNSPNVDQYGKLRVILKNNLRPNTTVTIGDSLREGVVADNITNSKPDLTNMGMYTKGTPTHMGGIPTADYLEVQISQNITVNDIETIYAPQADIEAIKKKLQEKGLDIQVLPRKERP